MQQNIRFKFFLCHSKFSEAMTPVTIYTHVHACLTVVLRCPYILGLGWAGTCETRSNSQLQMFSSELDLILHPQKFSTMNNLQYTVPVIYETDKFFPFLLLACLTNVSISLCTALSVVWSCDWLSVSAMCGTSTRWLQ